MKKALSDALEAKGYDTLTPVQQAVLDPDLNGLDLLVSAQTGSGKTLGFGLAIAPTLLGEAETFTGAGAPLALVIAPTRELAMQVKRELSWLYAKAGANLASCVGGMDMRDERRTLGRGAHIVVATPGRLRDHIMRGSIDLSQLRAVVLDEADEMLDLGFREDLEFILGEAPDTRQTLLFSATVPNSIMGLAKSYQKDAVRVVAKSERTQHADIEYKAMSVADRDADNAVINILRYFEAPNAIVFGNTRAMVNRLTTRLSNRGFQVVALSGELSQAERTNALQAMRDGRARVCVATDVAARGIDLPNLDLVVHAELPSNHETLLHRSGRTGRAGRKGVSALIVTKKTQKKAQRILGMAKLSAEWTNAPSADAVNAQDETRMLADPDWQVPVAEAEAETVANLTTSFTSEQLAAAYLRLFRSRHSAPEELSDVDAKPKPRVEFGASVWFSVAGGRNAGAEPRRLLPMLCKAGDLTKDDIGAIRIQPDESYVQILESRVASFLAAVGPKMTVEDGAKLTQLAGPPKFEREAPRAHSKPYGKSQGKPQGKPYGKPQGKPEGKPQGRGPAKHGVQHGAKPAAKQADRPHQRTVPYAPDSAVAKPDEHREKPKAQSSQPIDWNDAPVPRVKKPKPASKSGKPKPHRGGSAPTGDARSKPEGKRDGKPARSATDPSVRMGKPRHKGKGAPPPAGKPSSKKNRARAQAAKSAAPGKGGKSGPRKGPKS